MNGKQYKIIIFDFDGTLADTAECIVKTCKTTLEQLRLPLKTDDEIRNVIGLPLDQCFSTLMPEADDSTIERCCEVYRSLFFSFQEQTIRLFPKVRETLCSLHSAGIIVAIATSRGTKSLKELCQMFNIDDFVGMKMASDLVTEKKPAPEMVNKILAHYSINPSDALVVGDTIFDIEMGQRANCDTCGVTYGNHTRCQIEKAKPTYIADEIDEILRF